MLKDSIPPHSFSIQALVFNYSTQYHCINPHKHIELIEPLERIEPIFVTQTKQQINYGNTTRKRRMLSGSKSRWTR